MWRIVSKACLIGVLAFVGYLHAGETKAGFLKVETKDKTGKSTTKLIPYAPREGDLVFYDDRNPRWMALFEFAGTGPPLHMGIVVKNKAGKFAVLEAGPDDRVRVELLDLEKRLPQFQRDFSKGTIAIRRCKKTLTAEQSQALTKFAHAQVGKRYAIGRLLIQGTPLRARGEREEEFGKTVLDRDSWICSELAVAAGTLVKLFDPKVVHANVAYPKDLVDNQRYKLGNIWHDAALWRPDASTKDTKSTKGKAEK